MSYVIFENDGVIDVRSIRTFGVSVKEGDNPIGYFGTGLKYALAVLKRENHSVTMLAGYDKFEFKVEDIDVRNKTFKIIKMNELELPFTTELGKGWDMWQSFREIYCNCLDEGGSVYLSDEIPDPVSGKTFFIIKGREFQSLYHERDSIVLNISDDLLLASGDTLIYNKPSQHLYYRGVRVHQFAKRCLFTYNLNKQTELTEDRTLRWTSTELSRLPKAVASMDNKSAIKTALCCIADYQESDFIYSSLKWCEDHVSDNFNSVLEEQYNLNTDLLNRSAINYHMEKLNTKAFKSYQVEAMSKVEAIQMKRCVDICSKAFPDSSDYDIMVVKNLGEHTMALADLDARKMVISKKAFRFGTKFLLSTMIEEYAHLKTGYGDETRELQTWLFDTICTVIEDHMLNEPV